MIWISNDLYVSSTLSAFPLEHSHSFLMYDPAQAVPQHFIDSRRTLAAKRNLGRILRARISQEISLVPGNMVKVFFKEDDDKRTRCRSPRVVLKVSHSSCTITLPESRVKTVQVAVEDVRPAITDGSFASHVRDAKASLDEDLSMMLLRTPVFPSCSRSSETCHA